MCVYSYSKKNENPYDEVIYYPILWSYDSKPSWNTLNTAVLGINRQIENVPNSQLFRESSIKSKF